MLDQTDWEILRWLRQDSRMQWKEIGLKVHMTGQAVAARIRKMEDLGIIESFTVSLGPGKLGRPVTAFITVFMKTTDHQGFEGFLAETEAVAGAHRISGDGCYQLEVNVADQQELNNILEDILKYGNYRINLSIGRIK